MLILSKNENVFFFFTGSKSIKETQGSGCNIRRSCCECPWFEKKIFCVTYLNMSFGLVKFLPHWLLSAHKLGNWNWQDCQLVAQTWRGGRISQVAGSGLEEFGFQELHKVKWIIFLFTTIFYNMISCSKFLSVCVFPFNLRFCPCSYTEERQVQESFPVEETDEQNYPSDESLTMEDVNNNHITSHIKSHCSSNEDHFKAGNRKTEKQCKEREKYENQVKSRGGKHNFPQNNGDSDVFHGLLDGHHQKAKSVSRERTKSEPGKSGLVREINKKSKMSKGGNDSSSHESKAKFSKMSSVMSSSDSKIKKRPKSGEEDHANLKYNSESNTKDRSKRENKKAKRKHDGAGRDSEKPSMSFESCLSYDVNGAKAGPKKHCKKIKTAPKDPVTTFKSPTVTQNITSPKQVHLKAVVQLLKCRYFLLIL